MRVALLTTLGEHCGIAAYSRELGKALGCLADVTVTEIEPGEHPADYYRAQAECLNQADIVHIQHEYAFWGGIYSRGHDFQNLVKAIHKPLIITAHTTTPLREMIKLAAERRPLPWLVKSFMVHYRPFRESIERFPFDAGEVCIVHTSQARTQLIERGMDPSKIHILEAGIPAALPAPTHGQVVRERFGFVDKRIITLFGYITATKGYDVVLAALPELPPDVVLLIAGGARVPEEEAYVQSLRDQIEAAGLQDRVGITGHMNDVDIAEAMEATDVALTPHTRATGSYSVCIALAYGKPVIASDHACFQDIQRDAACLRLFRNGDAAHFAACAKAVLGNEAGQREMSARAVEYARARSWEAVAQKTHEIYSRVLSG